MRILTTKAEKSLSELIDDDKTNVKERVLENLSDGTIAQFTDGLDSQGKPAARHIFFGGSEFSFRGIITPSC